MYDLHRSGAMPQEWLESYLRANGGTTGTVHWHEGGALHLAASVNVPEDVKNATILIPAGKGMAGIALQEGRPVSTCNLSTDTSPVIPPGARSFALGAAVALPVFDGQRNVIAVVGIAFAEARDLEESDIERLSRGAETLLGPETGSREASSELAPS